MFSFLIITKALSVFLFWFVLFLRGTFLRTVNSQHNLELELVLICC